MDNTKQHSKELRGFARAGIPNLHYRRVGSLFVTEEIMEKRIIEKLPNTLDTEVTIKVRHQEGDNATLERIKGMTVIGTNACPRHHTIAIVGFTKDSKEDGVNVQCAVTQLMGSIEKITEVSSPTELH